VPDDGLHVQRGVQDAASGQPEELALAESQPILGRRQCEHRGPRRLVRRRGQEHDLWLALGGRQITLGEGPLSGHRLQLCGAAQVGRHGVAQGRLQSVFDARDPAFAVAIAVEDDVAAGAEGRHALAAHGFESSPQVGVADAMTADVQAAQQRDPGWGHEEPPGGSSGP